MSNYRKQRTDKVLDRLVTAEKLTPAGKSWLIEACDPFHDIDMDISGYPDLETASTIVQLVKTQYTVNVPTSAGTGNWDAHISLFPAVSPMAHPAVIQVMGALITEAAGVPVVTPITNQIGGVVAMTAPAGVPMWASGDTLPAASVTLGGQSTPIAYAKGAFRVIGAAFEVLNTTAEINLQGQVTVYRQPCFQAADVLSSISLSTPEPDLQVINTLRMPPATLEEAMLLFGSRSWKARDGVYCVGMLNDLNDPLQAPSFKTNSYTSNDIQAGVYGPLRYITINNDSTFNGNVADAIMPFDITGAYFTGLSNSTTLVVNCRWLIERCPTSNEADLVVLAQPSPCYDPMAFQIYSEVMRQMPPGVPQGENPLGEWFNQVLDVVAAGAPYLGAAVGGAFANPVAGGAIGAGIGQGVKAIAAYRRSKNQNDGVVHTQGSASHTGPKDKKPQKPSIAGKGKKKVKAKKR